MAEMTDQGGPRPHSEASETPFTVSTLSEALRNTPPGTIAAETHRAYSRALRTLGTQLGRQPVEDDSLGKALRVMASDGLSASTLTQCVAAVRFAARRASLRDPVGPACDSAMRAHRRGSPPRQAPAVDWVAADAAAEAAAAAGGPIGLRDAAVVAVMSDALLRVSEAAALNTIDIKAVADGSGRVAVRRSKTDQNGDGTTLYLRVSTMARIGAWQAMYPLGDRSDSLFRRVLRGGHVTADRLSARTIGSIVTKAAAAVGIEGASGHSLRVGAAQSLVSGGASLPEAMRAGRWASPTMLARYARHELAGRGAVAKLRPDTDAT